MNALARYINQGSYEPIHQDQFVILGRVAPIAATLAKDVAIGKQQPAAEDFEARANLQSKISLLKSASDLDPATLAVAHEAALRIGQRPDLEPWADALANDLAKLRD